MFQNDRIEIGVSRHYVFMMAVVFAILVTVTGYWIRPFWLAVLVMFLLVASACFWGWRYCLLLAPSAIRGLSWDLEKFELQRSDGQWLVVKPSADSVILPFVLLLVMDELDGRRRYCVPLFSDSAPGAQLRRLRVRLLLNH